MFYNARVGAARNQHPTNVRYYAANRERERLRVRLRQRARSEFLRSLKRRPCADCGIQYLPHQMDFDHREPATKRFVLAAGRVGLMNVQRVLEALA